MKKLSGYQKLKAEIEAREVYEDRLLEILKQLKCPDSILEAKRMELNSKLFEIYNA